MDKKGFWDKKILNWEESRYNCASAPGTLKVGNPGGRYLVGRIQLTLQLLKPYLQNTSVLDLGCGSGILAMHLLEAGARSVRGIDLSSTAIEKAKERMRAIGLNHRTTFEASAVQDLETVHEDIAVSLGLTDWISFSDIRKMFQQIGGRPFVVSFSEDRPSLTRLLHQVYVFFRYGWKSRGYVPHYYHAQDIFSFLPEELRRRSRLVRDRRLGFGILLTNLPEEK